MLDLGLFGEMRLAGTDCPLPPGHRPKALLGWLALHPGRHSRSRLAGVLWPDVRESSARASLRSALWALRPAIGSVLISDRDAVGLGPDIRVDVREFRRLLAVGEIEAAVGLAADELLRDIDDDWVVRARADIDRDLAAALADLTARAVAAGDKTGALRWARQWAARCPLDEAAGHALIRALMDAGDASAAADAYRRLRDGLRVELGVTVSAEISALVAPARISAPHLDATPPLDPEPHSGGGRASQPDRKEADRLVGRDQQYAVLADMWRQARAGEGTTVLIEGEGGIGKTRLVQELIGTAEKAGGCLAVLAGAAPGNPAPFAVWTEALSDLPGPAGGADDEVPCRWQADLAPIVPALGYRDAAATTPGRPKASGDPRLDQVRLYEAVVQYLGYTCRQAPLLLALEDLHAADNASLELVAYAGRRLRRLPVLLVLTRRELPARAQLDAVLAALRARGALGAEIRLGPLDAAASRRLIRSAADLPERMIARIAQVGGGNPLLTVEAARSAAAAGAATGAAAGVAATGVAATGVAAGVAATGVAATEERAIELTGADLAGTVRRAIGTLSVPARLFAEFAAVAGRDLDRAEVAALPLPSPARHAAEALGCGLLRTAGGRCGYRHALLRDAVYQSIPDPQRARLHSEFAALLRQRGTSGRRPPAAEIARHLLLAGQEDQAAAQLVIAARDARAVAALAEAAGFLTEAVRIIPDDAELSVELAEVEAFRGLLASSDRAFEHAMERIAPEDSGALVSAWLRRGRWLRGGICHPRESRRCYRSALDVLDREPDEDRLARAEALAGLAWAEAVGGDPAAVDPLLAEADQILGERPDDLLAHDISVVRAHTLIRAGRFTECYAPLVAAANAAGRAGRPDMAYSCLANAASAATAAGDPGRALDFADRALSLVTPNGLLRLCVYAQVARSEILRRLGRTAEARQACEAAGGYASRVGVAEVDGLVHAERGLLAASAGDHVTAAADLGEALRLDAPVSRAATRLRLAEALARSGLPEQAEAELRAAVLEPVGLADFPATLVAWMSRVQGLVALARGDMPLARRRLTESAASWQRIVESLDGGQAGAGYAAALIDLGRPPLTALVEPAAELASVRCDLAAIRS